MKELILENPPTSRRSHRRRTASSMKHHRSHHLHRSRYSTRRDKRHHFRFGGFSVHRNPAAMREVFSGQVLTMALGAVSASVVSNFAISKVGGYLPGINNGFGRAAYNLIIPVAGAWAASKLRATNLSRGLVIGGLANAFGQIITTSGILPPMGSTAAPAPALPAPPAAPALPAASSTTAATGMYLGEYLHGPFPGSAW